MGLPLANQHRRAPWVTGHGDTGGTSERAPQCIGIRDGLVDSPIAPSEAGEYTKLKAVDKHKHEHKHKRMEELRAWEGKAF